MRFLLYFAPFLLLIESLDSTSINGTTGNPVKVANEAELERLNKIENDLNDVKQEFITLEQIKPTRVKEDELTRKVNREQKKYNELKDEIERLIKKVETNMCNERSLTIGSQCYNFQKDLNAKTYLLDRANSLLTVAIAKRDQYLMKKKEYEAKQANLLDRKMKLEGNVKIMESELTSAAEEAKNNETEPILQAKVKRSDKEVNKKVYDVMGNQKEHEESNGKVKAMASKSADEKNNEEEAKKDVGFPLWPIAIFVVVVLIVGGAFLKLGKMLKKILKGRNDSNDLVPGIRYEVDKMPRNTPEVVKEVLAEDAKTGSTAYFVESKTDKCDEIYYKSKCNLEAKVDMDGNQHCLYPSHQLIFNGPLKVKENHPLLHRNVYEDDTTAVKFTNPLEHNLTMIRAYTYGPEPGAQIMEKMNPEYEKDEDESPMFPKMRPKNGNFVNPTELLVKSPNESWPLFELAQVSCMRDVETLISLLSHHHYVFNGERVPFTSTSTRVIHEILDKVQTIFAKEHRLIEMSAPVAVIGDIHGQYNMLHYMFATRAKGSTPGWAMCRWVLLGNYVDRGHQSLEVIVFLFLLKILNPNSMCMLRGNHEEPKVNLYHGFGKELIDRFGEDGVRLFERFNEVFEKMPFACVISGAVLCVHGGINESMRRCDPWIIHTKSARFNPWLSDILWANPMENFTKSPGASDSVRKGRTADNNIVSRDRYFGANDVKEMFERCGLQLLVRGHQRMMNGCKFGPGGHLILTVYSSNVSIEGKDYTNFAGTVFFPETGRIETTFLMRGLDDEKKNLRFFMDTFKEHNDLVEYDVQCKDQPEGLTESGLPPIHEPGTGNIPPSGDPF